MSSRNPAIKSPVNNSRATRGIALIAVLWAVMLLALMAQSFTTDVRTGTQLTQNLVANSKAQALADAAVHLAIERLLSERADANNVYDGSAYHTTIGGADLEITVQDESGKIDLNTAQPALKEKLFQWAVDTPDEARAIVDAIADWGDRDSLRRLNGAEESDYRLANLGYEPKNQAFDSVEELRLVLGITPALFEKIRTAVTVHARRPRVDLRVATPTVLAAILRDEDRLAELLDTRQEDASTRPTALASDVPKSFTAPSPRTTFTIRAMAKTAGGASFTREAIIRIATRRGRPFTILAWRRGRLSPSINLTSGP